MTRPVDPAEAFEKLWASQQRPDLQAFATQEPALTAEQLAALVRIDQRERSRLGESIRAEEYLASLPRLAAESDWALDVVYHEYLLREQRGERPTAAEYAARFPQYAHAITDQIGLHNAMAQTPAVGEPTITLVGETPPSVGRSRPRFGTLPVHFGRYRIMKLIGQGGMGDVYLAEDSLLRRQVALKFPRFEGDTGGEALARFRREAQIAAGFHHPNLCPIYDFGQMNGIWFLSMPYITGQPLSALIAQRGRLPEAEAISMVSSVARAMAVAHAAGVVHRDLKPANILLKDDRQPVVTDFGLARRSERLDVSLTGAGALVGTPAYMAPEQIGQAADEVSAASDIYSLGVILFEMLAGRPPFVGRVDQVLRQIVIDIPPPLSQTVSGVSPALEAACFKALSKDPSERFASMDEFARALQPSALSETIVQARPPATLPIAPSRAFTRRRVIVGSGIAVVTAIGLWALWQRIDNSSPDSTVPAADELTAGSFWKGRFRFVGMDYVGEVQVTIEERADDEFYGIYETENSDYVWAIKGTLRGEKIRWVFTDVVREKEPRFVVGKAYVDGVCRGSQMNVSFRHPGNNTRAEMVLGRVE